MSCSDRRQFLATLSALGLTAGITSACGFAPVYGENGNGRALRGAIRADDPVSRSDFNFVAAFEDRLGRPNAARYGLSYRITKREVSSGAVQDIGATRIQLFGTLNFTVTDLTTGAQRATGELERNATYSNTSTQLATLTAAEDADLRLMEMLADALVTRLLTEPGLVSTDM